MTLKLMTFKVIRLNVLAHRIALKEMTILKSIFKYIRQTYARIFKPKFLKSTWNSDVLKLDRQGGGHDWVEVNVENVPPDLYDSHLDDYGPYDFGHAIYFCTECHIFIPRTGPAPSDELCIDVIARKIHES